MVKLSKAKQSSVSSMWSKTGRTGSIVVLLLSAAFVFVSVIKRDNSMPSSTLTIQQKGGIKGLPDMENEDERDAGIEDETSPSDEDTNTEIDTATKEDTTTTYQPPVTASTTTTTTSTSAAELAARDRFRKHDAYQYVKYPLEWGFPRNDLETSVRKTLVEEGTRKVPSKKGSHVCKCLGTPDEQAAKAQGPFNFRWLHIPKTGTSFIITLWLHVTGASDPRMKRMLDTTISKYYRPQCPDCYDWTFMQRYPLELYGVDLPRTKPFANLHTSHLPYGILPADRRNDTQVLSFFRDPYARVVSAFDNGMHNWGNGEEYGMIRERCAGNVTCYAARPGQMGCMLRMLTNHTCSASTTSYFTLGLDKIGTPEYKDILRKAYVNIKQLAFIGFTEEWNDAICRFHYQFGGFPHQEQFQNVRLGTKKTTVDDLMPNFRDPADEDLIRMVTNEFQKRKASNPEGEQCYQYINATDDDTNMDEEECVPQTCHDMDKQCGEWPDGCGGTIVCGICNQGTRDGLPTNWRFQCSLDGECIRTCPPWEEGGLWHRPVSTVPLSTNETNQMWMMKFPGVAKRLVEKILARTDKHLSPTDAVRICMSACRHRLETRASRTFTDHYCICGRRPLDFLNKSFAAADYKELYNLKPSKTVSIPDVWFKKGETQPMCCATIDPPIRPRMPLNSQWQAQGRKPPYNDWKEGIPFATYFMAFQLGCTGVIGCEELGHQYNATVVSHDPMNHMCYLGKDFKPGVGNFMHVYHEPRNFLVLKDDEWFEKQE